MPEKKKAAKKAAAKTPDEKQLADLLRRQYGQAERAKGAAKVLADARHALNKLKGKIAKTRARIASKKQSAPQRAVAWFAQQAGVSEKPDGSNWGVPVQNWIRSTGYTGPVPWCGCVTKVAVVDHGGAKIPTPIRLGFNEYIVADAEAGRNGLREVAIGAARLGDIVTFTFPHIAVVRGPVRNGMLPTWEGNTSPTSSGSQNNGGTVAPKLRPVSQVRVIARPDYPRR